MASAYGDVLRLTNQTLQDGTSGDAEKADALRRTFLPQLRTLLDQAQTFQGDRPEVVRINGHRVSSLRAEVAAFESEATALETGDAQTFEAARKADVLASGASDLDDDAPLATATVSRRCARPRPRRSSGRPRQVGGCRRATAPGSRVPRARRRGRASRAHGGTSGREPSCSLTTPSGARTCGATHPHRPSILRRYDLSL